MNVLGNEKGHAAINSMSPEMSLATTPSDDYQNAAKVSRPEPSTNPASLKTYVDRGFDLIPLRKHGDRDRTGKPIGKAPLKTDWRRRPGLSLSEAETFMAAGHNIGVRLNNDDLIIDVDPRNFAAGDDAFTRFQKEFGLSWAPVVMTGGGGQHWYFRKPEGLKIKTVLEGYAGIEFKTAGTQIVAAGSIHPETLRLYEFDPLSDSLSDIAEAPDGLLKCLSVDSADRSQTLSSGELTSEQLAFVLSHIDVLDFSDEIRWRELMMASHHATGGDGLYVFLDWSTSDPSYGNHGNEITKRWNSLKEKDFGITIRTLFKAVPSEKRGAVIEAVSRRAPEDDFPAEEEMPARAAASKSLGLYDEWVWVVRPYVFVRRSDGVKFKPEQWKSLYAARLPDSDIVTAVFRGKLALRKFEDLVYEPCKPEFPNGEDGKTYNLWKPSGVEALPGDVTIFLDHMAFLFPDEAERNHVLDYLALLVQKPDTKIHFALLIRGAQGTGKSWIGALMEKIIGRRNVVRPNNDEVNSRWTAWMEGAQLAILEELMTVGRKDVANRLKTIITEDTLRIEDKGCQLYTIPNRLNLLCFSNHEDAVYLETGDRRWLVVFSPAVKQPASYYERLFAYLAGDGAAYVKHWLMQRDIALNPKGVAPVTSGKTTMRDLSLGDVEAFVKERFEAGETPFDFDLVRIDDIVASIPSALRGQNSLTPKIVKFLRGEFGAVNHARYTKSDGKDRPAWTLWSVRNHDQWDKAGAAARIDAFVTHQNRLE